MPRLILLAGYDNSLGVKKNVSKWYIDSGNEQFREKMNRVWCLSMRSELTIWGKD